MSKLKCPMIGYSHLGCADRVARGSCMFTLSAAAATTS
jgi:hypothetical protein